MMNLERDFLLSAKDLEKLETEKTIISLAIYSKEIILESQRY